VGGAKSINSTLEPPMNHLAKVAAIAYITIVIAKRVPVLRDYL
jgi:hypothetical protein